MYATVWYYQKSMQKRTQTSSGGNLHVSSRASSVGADRCLCIRIIIAGGTTGWTCWNEKIWREWMNYMKERNNNQTSK